MAVKENVAMRLGVIYDSPGNQLWRERGLTSCLGRSRKLRAFTYKELETMKAAQKLLGEPTIDRGSAWAAAVTSSSVG